MVKKDDEQFLNILASKATAQRMSRRAFVTGSVVAAFSGGFLLSACGSDDDEPLGCHAPATGPRARPGPPSSRTS